MQQPKVVRRSLKVRDLVQWTDRSGINAEPGPSALTLVCKTAEGLFDGDVVGKVAEFVNLVNLVSIKVVVALTAQMWAFGWGRGR